MSHNISLQNIQRWMQQVITHPGGVEEGVQSPDAQEEIAVELKDLEDVVTASQQQSGLERLITYSKAYYARLLECLREEFPTLNYALGSEVFDGMMLAYLQANPSQSYSLADLGFQLSEYLQRTRPPEEPGAQSGDPDWIEMMIDIARLERTYNEVYDGEGVEQMKLLSPEDLQGVSPSEISHIRLKTVPCLRLLKLSFPVHLFASAVRNQENPEYPSADPTWLIVTRRDYVVRRTETSETQFQILSELEQGAALQEAILKVQAQFNLSNEDLLPNIYNWFKQWAQAGYFLTVER